jgi:hypothetical protein
VKRSRGKDEESFGGRGQVRNRRRDFGTRATKKGFLKEMKSLYQFWHWRPEVKGEIEGIDKRSIFRSSPSNRAGTGTRKYGE